MGFTLASVLLYRFVVGSEERELSVSPSGCPSPFSLRGQRKGTKRKATPRPRPSRIRARRVRVSPWVFVDRPSLACHEHRPRPCGRPCGLIHELPPLPRGPMEERGLLPARAGAAAKARAKAKAKASDAQATGRGGPSAVQPICAHRCLRLCTPHFTSLLRTTCLSTWVRDTCSERPAAARRRALRTPSSLPTCHRHRRRPVDAPPGLPHPSHASIPR
jgi:hypothetical protein